MVVKKKLPFNFRSPSAEVVRKQILALQGQDKTGKTHFACTAPGPVMLINTDRGDRGVITPDKFPDKEIYIVDITPGSELLAESEGDDVIEEAWEEFRKAHEWGLANCATVIWDKADHVWELARLKHLGGLTKIMPHQYTEVNNTFRYLIKAADKQAETNLILLHNVKEQYVNERFTGNLIRAGFKETGGLVDTCIETFFEDGAFGGRVIFCRQNMELCGEELSGVEWDYETLLERIFG